MSGGRGFADAKQTIGVAQTLPFPGKKSLDKQIGGAGVKLSEAELALRHIELVRDVKAAFFRVLASERSVEVSAQLVTVAEASATTMPRGFGIQLRLAPLAPQALHGGDGWIDFGAAGGSYYYSRTRMAASGTIVVDGARLAVTGTAWFDHQWGDFIAVGGGGWDWFAISLDDGTDLMLSLVRSADGTNPLVYGTLVLPDGTSRPVARAEITVDALGHWTSARTGAIYPSGWRVRVSGAGLDLTVVPTVRDQELDTRATTGVVYWEGSETVTGTRSGRPVTGKGYVELTGYADQVTAAP